MSAASKRRSRKAAWFLFALFLLSAIAALCFWLFLGEHLAVWIALGSAALALFGLLLVLLWRLAAGLSDSAAPAQRRERRAQVRFMRAVFREVYRQNRLRGARPEPPRVVLLVGPPGHGKSALLRAAYGERELRQLEPAPALPGVTCWAAQAYERGASALFVELSVEPTNTSSGTVVRKAILALRRARLPVRNLLVCLSAESLLAPGSTQKALQELAGVVEVTVDALGVRLPIDLVITKSDRVAGLAEFYAELDERQRPESISLYSQRGTFSEDARRWVDWLRNRRLALVVAGDAKREKIRDPETWERRARLFTLVTQMERLFDAAQRTSELLKGASEGFVRALHLGIALVPASDEVPSDRVLDGLVPCDASFHAVSRLDIPSSARFLLRTAIVDHSPLERSSAALLRARLNSRLVAASACLALVYSGLQMVGSARGNQERLQSIYETFLQARDGTPLASQAELAHLEKLRDLTEAADAEARDGAPRALRWGLYQGVGVYDYLRAAFLGMTQERVVRPIVEGLEDALGVFARSYEGIPQRPNSIDYDRAYRQLKTYLLLTSERTRLENGRDDEFVSDLAEYGSSESGNAVAPDTLRPLLASYLRLAEPDRVWQVPEDKELVERVRVILRRAELEDQLLKKALAFADGSAKEFVLRNVSLSNVFSNDALSVRSAFTNAGWQKVHERLEDAGAVQEDWVLGGRAGDVAAVHAERQSRLAKAYVQQYGDHWSSFLDQVALIRFGDLDGALQLLQSLTSSGQEPLRSLWNALHDNLIGLPRPGSVIPGFGSTDEPETREEGRIALQRRFGPLVSFGVAGQMASANGAPVTSLDRYHASLLKVAEAIKIAQGDPSKKADLLQEVEKAIQETTRSIDQAQLGEYRISVSQLLLAPLERIAQLVRTIDYCLVNDKWRSAVLARLDTLVDKYPFVSVLHLNGSAPLSELGEVFHPTKGSIAAFRDQQLSEHVEVVGQQVVRKETGKKSSQVDDDVLQLLNEAMEIGRSLFEGEEPGVSFSLFVRCGTRLGEIQFVLDGVQAQGFCLDNDVKTFRWPGKSDNPGATAVFGNDVEKRKTTFPGEGEWGLWRLLEHPNVALHPKGSYLEIEFKLHDSQVVQWDLKPEGSAAPLFLRKPLLAPFRAQVFQRLPRRLFAGLDCPEVSQ